MENLLINKMISNIKDRQFSKIHLSDLEELIYIAEHQNKIKYTFDQLLTSETETQKQIIYLLIEKKEFHKYLQYFKHIRISSLLYKFFKNKKLIELFNSLEFVNYDFEEETIADRKMVFRTLLKLKNYDEIELFIKKYKNNDYMMFNFATMSLSRGEESCCMMLLDGIKDWKKLNPKIAINSLSELMLENNSRVLSLLKNNIVWRESRIIYTFYKEEFNQEFVDFLTTEKEKALDYLASQFGFKPNNNIFKPIMFNINTFNKSIKNKVVEIITNNPMEINSVIGLLNYITLIQKAFPDIDSQMYLKYLINFDKTKINIINFDILQDGDLIESLCYIKHYPNRRMLDLLIEHEPKLLAREYSLFNSQVNELRLYGIEDKDFFPKKPKNINEIFLSVKNKVEKTIQSNFILEQDNIAFLHGKNVDGYVLKLPKDSYELIDIGHKLNNCVGNADYSRKIKEKETNVLILYANDSKTIIGVVEIKGNEIIQCKGHNNSNITLRLPSEYKKQIKPLG